MLRYKEKKFGEGSKEYLKSKENLALTFFELKRYREGLDNLCFCLRKYKELLVNDSREGSKATYTEFLKQFTSKMRELCKTESSLDDLK